jgi:hypothetical protein
MSGQVSVFRKSLRPSEAAIYGGLFVLVVAVFIFGEPPEATLFWDGIFDVGHTVLFAFLMWLALRVLERAYPGFSTPGWRHTAALAAILALAGASEALQQFQPTRDPTLGDFLRDVIGAASVLLLRLAASTAPGAESRWWMRPVALRTMAASLLFLVAAQFALVGSVYIERARAFPTLLRLDGSRWERRLLWVRSADLMPNALPSKTRDTAPLALLALRPGVFSGITLHEPYPDWTGHTRLVFDVRSDVAALVTLTVRINDRQFDGRDEDRFSTNIELVRGHQSVQIALEDIRTAPQGRELDLRQIRRVAVFVWHLGRATNLYLGALRLE